MMKFRFLKELMLIRQVNQKNAIYVTTGIFKINDGITILTILLFWTFAIFFIIVLLVNLAKVMPFLIQNADFSKKWNIIKFKNLFLHIKLARSYNVWRYWTWKWKVLLSQGSISIYDVDINKIVVSDKVPFGK